jgi:hypothetical protein
MLPQVLKNIFEMQRKRNIEEKKGFLGGRGLFEFLLFRGFLCVLKKNWILLEFLFPNGFKGVFLLNFFLLWLLLCIPLLCEIRLVLIVLAFTF